MMFKQLRNIDTAFSHIKKFSLWLISGCTVICVFAIYASFNAVMRAHQQIYVLANGKILQAVSGDRKDNIAVEAKDHVQMFHHWFFTLDPDENVIKRNLAKALNLADETARKAYLNLKEQGYYNNIIAANISQTLTVDSIQLDTREYPYKFKCFASQKLVRSTSSVSRKLITMGELRNVSRSENNPHGFLIQKWETIQNDDIDTLRQEGNDAERQE